MRTDLKQYDGKCIRIINTSGDAFDGICIYYAEEYDEHEYGRCEESLKIESFMFFRSDIKEVIDLEGHQGPYGRFSDPYGTLEILTVEDGIDSIRDMLFSEEDEHVLRLLRCLSRYLDPEYGHELPCRKEIPDALRELRDATENEEIRREADRLVYEQ